MTAVLFLVVGLFLGVAVGARNALASQRVEVRIAADARRALVESAAEDAVDFEASEMAL